MRTVVFLGPSLSVDTARSIFPEAWYCEPCRCGDILRVLRLRPNRILLIDGHFSWTPAPWHKEFLLALDQGVEVYGASSMGALRAAELAHFGVIGVGRIYEDFASGRIDCDDEVAVMHADESFDYREMNDALVNVRYTLDRAVTAGQISRVIATELLERVRRKYFPERNLVLAVQEYALEQNGDLSSFLRWLEQGNAVDQKGLDAIEALRRVKDDPPARPSPPRTNYTRYIRELIRWTSCSPFRTAYDWLPESEIRLTTMAESDPHVVEALRGVAEGLIHATAVAQVTELWPGSFEPNVEAAELACELTHRWNGIRVALASAASWLIAQSEAIGLSRFVIDAMASFLENISSTVSQTFVREGSGMSEGAQAERNDLFRQAMRVQALLVLCLGSLARGQGVTVKPSIFEKDLAAFRASNALEDSESMSTFLGLLGLQGAEFGVLFFDYLNYRRVFCCDRSDALLESMPSPVQFVLGDAFECVSLSLKNWNEVSTPRWI